MKSFKKEETSSSNEISREFAKILDEYNDPRTIAKKRREKITEEIKEDKLSTYGII